ncbi:hypothetical protein FOL47_011185 [Perkinsus chesapeaki]|uniref:Uncharacterized protein n=1 Tax=Perkinsus chesapeaki TaxID=330153 RepID=A0A7J6KZD2_PERCH|nr:hypothetical protein FOL47_011185 [Perkinsus chesapeaki]
MTSFQELQQLVNDYEESAHYKEYQRSRKELVTIANQLRAQLWTKTADLGATSTNTIITISMINYNYAADNATAITTNDEEDEGMTIEEN